jgi:transposase
LSYCSNSGSRLRSGGDWPTSVIDANLPEATRLAKTVESWWLAILVGLIHDVSNARTEGFNG